MNRKKPNTTFLVCENCGSFLFYVYDRDEDVWIYHERLFSSAIFFDKENVKCFCCESRAMTKINLYISWNDSAYLSELAKKALNMDKNEIMKECRNFLVAKILKNEIENVAKISHIIDKL